MTTKPNFPDTDSIYFHEDVKKILEIFSYSFRTKAIQSLISVFCCVIDITIGNSAKRLSSENFLKLSLHMGLNYWQCIQGDDDTASLGGGLDRMEKISTAKVASVESRVIWNKARLQVGFIGCCLNWRGIGSARFSRGRLCTNEYRPSVQPVHWHTTEACGRIWPGAQLRFDPTTPSVYNDDDSILKI